MQPKRVSAHVVLIVLVAMVPLTGVDCDETGDFFRGLESRTFASAVTNQLSSGIVTALACEIGGRVFLGNVPNAGLRACDPSFDESDSTTGTTE